MATLMTRGVDDGVHAALIERARAHGQSLQVFLLALVQEAACSSTNLALLDRFTASDDGSHMTSSEADEAVENHRAERDGRAGPTIT